MGKRGCEVGSDPEEDFAGAVLTWRALETKRCRKIWSQEAQEEHVQTRSLIQEATPPSRASNSGQSAVDLEASVRLVGRFEEGCAGAVLHRSPANIPYAGPEPMASEVGSTNEGGVLLQVSSYEDDGRTPVTDVVEALMDDASSQPPGVFAAFNDESKAATGTSSTLSVMGDAELDEWGRPWFFRLKAVTDAFESSPGPQHGAFIAARDAGVKGAKMYTIFPSTAAFETYVARIQAAGRTPSMYEVLLSAEASWLYFDLDYVSPSEQPGDFSQRREHLHHLLEHFGTHVLKLPPGQFGAPQVAAAHGAVGFRGPYKSSVHEVFKGAYFGDLEARAEFKKAFAHFLDHPPAELAFSAEFVGFTKPDSGVRARIWDPAVYSSNQNWRALGSCKLMSSRILCPEKGSSERASDHFIGIRGVPDLKGALKVDVDLLRAFNAEAARAPGKLGVEARHAPVRRTCLIQDPERDELLQRDLGSEEVARLLNCAQTDHPGATLGSGRQICPGVFTVRIHAPPGSRTCRLAGREHTSEGNGQYLLYRRANPAEVVYRCFSPHCKNDERLLSLQATGFVWSDDYSLSTGMRPYPTTDIRPDTFQTILVKANKGIGKSKAGTTFLVEMIEKNPSASCVVIAGNVALASKHLDELHRAGLSDFVLYSDVEGSIKDSRVVVCINSVPRLSSLDKDIVYMDEIDMTLGNLNSDVMRDRRYVFMTLHTMVQAARVVVGLDANVDSPRVLEWLQTLRPEAAMHAIRNSGVRMSERTATIWPLPPGCKLADRFAPVIGQILKKVDAGLNIWVASTSRSFIEQLETSFGERFSGTDKCILSFHGGKTSSEDKERLQRAVADPDSCMVAHCLGYSPTIGPGVSMEAKHYHGGIGIGLNRPKHGPDVFTFTQMLQRVRDGGDIDIYYLEDPPPNFVPTTKEHVFNIIEREDTQLYALVKPSEVCDFLQKRGARPVCDRTSATCNVYANNVLARFRSMTSYVDFLMKDLREQGLLVVNKLGKAEAEHPLPSAERASAPPDPDASLPDEEWRKKYCISSKQNCGLLRKRTALEGLSKLEEKQLELYYCANNVYQVDYGAVDHAFSKKFCNEEKIHMYQNYRRFQKTSAKDLRENFECTLRFANESLPTKDYLKERDMPKHLVPFASTLLATMLSVQPEALDGSLLGESYHVPEEGLQAAYKTRIEPQLRWAKRWYEIKQSKVPKDDKGKPVMTDALKRNAVKRILEKGLGLTFVAVPGKRSNNEFVKPHEFSPELWKEVHARYSTAPTVSGGKI